MKSRGAREWENWGNKMLGLSLFSGSPALRLGLFGGTFNPIHIGHLKMAEAARKQFELDVVYFIPCGIPPHKPIEKSLPAKLRYDLVKKAIKGKKCFKVLDIEIKKRKPAYTIETINELRKRKYSAICNSQSAIFFLIGADEFEKLHKWKKPNELAKSVHFLVLPRLSKKVKAPQIKNLKWSLVHAKPIDVSSSEIREKIKDRKSVVKWSQYSKSIRIV